MYPDTVCLYSYTRGAKSFHAPMPLMPLISDFVSFARLSFFASTGNVDEREWILSGTRSAICDQPPIRQ